MLKRMERKKATDQSGCALGVPGDGKRDIEPQRRSQSSFLMVALFASAVGRGVPEKPMRNLPAQVALSTNQATTCSPDRVSTGHAFTRPLLQAPLVNTYRGPIPCPVDPKHQSRPLAVRDISPIYFAGKEPGGRDARPNWEKSGGSWLADPGRGKKRGVHSSVPHSRPKYLYSGTISLLKTLPYRKSTSKKKKKKNLDRPSRPSLAP